MELELLGQGRAYEDRRELTRVDFLDAVVLADLGPVIVVVELDVEVGHALGFAHVLGQLAVAP